MSISCPNKRLKVWKDLVQKVGENKAYLLWAEYDGNVPDNYYSELPENVVKSGLKATDILMSEKAIQIFEKGNKNNWSLEKILNELQIPKNQKELILNLNINDREEIALELASKYTNIIEINISNKKQSKYLPYNELNDWENTPEFLKKDYHGEGKDMIKPEKPFSVIDEDGKIIEYFDTLEEAENKSIELNEKLPKIPSDYYSDLTVPGGTNYAENEISTPAITPSIKGHADFSTDNGIGWFRSDDQLQKGQSEFNGYEPTERELIEFRKNYTPNTRRILELQSDLFQKGRNKEDLTTIINSKIDDWKYKLSRGGINTENGKIGYNEDSNKWFIVTERGGTKNITLDEAIELSNGRITKQEDIKGNQFLQLLNKDNNWVTFFVKSIIQDSVKKGYEKVLFPTGDTASKIEEHQTLEEYKKEREDKIKKLEEPILKAKKEGVYKLDSKFMEMSFIRKDNKWYQKIDGQTNFKQEYTIESIFKLNLIAIDKLKKELEQIEIEGYGSLKPIWNFYENVVINVLNKIYGKNNVKLITDEYGNKWNEIVLKDEYKNTILFNKDKFNLTNLLNENKKEEIFNVDSQVEKFSNLDKSQKNKQLLFNSEEKKSYTVSEVLNNIIKQGDKDLKDNFKILLNKSEKILNNTKANVEIDSLYNLSKKYKNIDNDVVMIYDDSTNKIIITEESLKSLNSQQIIQSFIHEVVHAISIKALRTPQTFEEKEFKKLIEEAYEQHKNIASERSDVKENYGFENIYEFVAEIYSNPDFQNEIKKNTSFWNEFKNILRRMFGLIKSLKNNNLIEDVLIINKIENFIEKTNNSEFKGYSFENDFSFDALFIKKSVITDSEGYSLETIEKQIDNIINKAKDNLEQNIKYYQTISNSIKDETKKNKWMSFIDNFNTTLNSLEKIQQGKELDSILKYVNSLEKDISNLKYSFENKEFTEDETIQVIHNYTKYLDTFTIYKDIQKLLANIKTNNKFENDKIDISEIENSLSKVISEYDSLKAEYTSYLKHALKLKLSNLKYLPELETMWKNNLKEEYKSSPKNISEIEWIANEMNTTYKNDIENDIQLYLDKLINNPSFDISIGTRFFNDSINTNSHLIQIFNQILNEIKEEINQTMREKEFELKNLFDKLVKEKGSSNPSILYKNLVFKNPNGNYSLVQNNENLTNTEKEVIKTLIEIQDFTDFSTYRKQSKRVKINGKIYYELPSITKTDLERILEGDIKGTIKDKWTDLTTIKADDIEFRYRTDNEYNLLYNVPVRYRGKIDSKDQSLDLFTIYRLEYLNGVNFKVKTKAEKDLTTILDIAKSKNYYRTQGTKDFVKSIFNKRNDISLISGENSNTALRLQSLLEKNIYDIGNHYAGKLGPIDINKAISFVNSTTAAIGLNLNRYAATANVLNAKSQLFLESISKNIINKSNIAKAELLYSKELPNTLNDLGQSVEKSFINQMNRMFDTFGFNQNTMNNFVKQGILKSYSNLGSLQFMHKSGEHWVQSVLTASVLDSIKVMNDKNRFIDKNGNEVDEKKAASLLDMLYIDDKDGILKISDKVVYTSKSLTSKINEGGKEKINLLIKKKIFDCFGNYDKNTQPEAKRHAWGKLVLMFRGFFVEMLTRRFKTFGSSLKSKDEIESNPEKYKHYSYSLQDYEEGTYTSLLRFIKFGLIPMLKKLKVDIIKTEWNKLSDLEKANIKHSTSEIVLTSTVLPLIGMLLSSLLAGNDDDDEIIYFWMYQTRRLTTELAQFRNPSENIKITRSPIPSMRIIEQSLDALSKTVNVWSWNEEIKSGPNKGDLKVQRAWEKLIPVLNQMDKNSEDLYNYQKAFFGVY